MIEFDNLSNESYATASETIKLYLTLCAVFGKNAIYPFNDFIQMPYDAVQMIITEKNRLNIEDNKRQEEEANKRKNKLT